MMRKRKYTLSKTVIAILVMFKNVNFLKILVEITQILQSDKDYFWHFYVQVILVSFSKILTFCGVILPYCRL